MDAIERVIESWRARGVALNEPATEEVLGKLAGVFDGTVPTEVRRFYAMAGGMPEYSTEGFFLSFWSIDRILRENDVFRDGDLRWVAFADFLIYSHCLRLGQTESGVAVSIEAGSQRFPSLAAFFEQYLSDPETFGMAETD